MKNKESESKNTYPICSKYFAKLDLLGRDEKKIKLVMMMSSNQVLRESNS